MDDSKGKEKIELKELDLASNQDLPVMMVPRPAMEEMKAEEDAFDFRQHRRQVDEKNVSLFVRDRNQSNSLFMGRGRFLACNYQMPRQCLLCVSELDRRRFVEAFERSYSIDSYSMGVRIDSLSAMGSPSERKASDAELWLRTASVESEQKEEASAPTPRGRGKMLERLNGKKPWKNNGSWRKSRR